METKWKCLICLLGSVLLVILLIANIVLALFAAPQHVKHQSDFEIKINSIISSKQAFSKGFIYLQLTSIGGIILKGNVHMYLDGVEKSTYKTFPRNLQIPTFRLDDGSHTVSIMALSQDNRRGYGEIKILVEDPKMALVDIKYPREIYPGMLFMITLEISRPASYMEANYSSLFGYPVISTSDIHIGNIITDTLSIPTSFVSEEGLYSIPLVVYSTEGRTLKVPGIEIFFQSGVTNPFTIDEGIIDMRSFPLTTTTDSALNFTVSPSFEVSITTGQSVEISIVVTQNTVVNELVIGFEGYGQHFIIPITSLQNKNLRRSIRQTHSGNQTLPFILTLPIGSIMNGSQITMLIRLRNSVGELGPIRMIPITTALLKIGTLHVRLTWDKEVDLDLNVVDPYNEKIYYGHKISSKQQGRLDLDSNPACLIDHIRTENIFYEKAVSGKYFVRVNLYNACGKTGQINFQVLVDGCNISQTFNGAFIPLEISSGRQRSEKLISVFVVECEKYVVGGTITYKSGKNRISPLGSLVRVVNSQGNVLGTSQVVRDVSDSSRGVYIVAYNSEDGSTPVYVEFLSSNNKIEVTDHVGNIHVYRVNGSITPNLEANLTRSSIIREEDGSGAFNIMVTLSRMLPLYLAYGGEVTDYPLTANWERGKYAKYKNDSISYYSRITNSIYICGNPLNPDEFDSSVLLHEFGHLIMEKTGAVIESAGSHDGSHISPGGAFSEGYSTYLGQKVIGNLKYCDGFCFDLSKQKILDLFLGTIPGNYSSGNISEFLVAAAAYKLDIDIGLGTLIIDSLTDPNKLLKESNYNRLGSLSAVDLSDMVSIVVCPLDGPNKNKSADLLEKLQLPWITEAGFCI